MANDLFIIGGGPSLSQTNLELVKNKAVLGVNAAFRLGSWVDSMIFGDCRFYEGKEWIYKPYLDEYLGRKYTLCTNLKNDPRFIYYEKCEKHFLCLKKGKLTYITGKGKNSGCAAINLGVQLGYGRIVLLGFDGKATKKGKHNWHNWHTHIPQPDIYDKFYTSFKGLAEELKEKKPDVEVINASPNTKLDIFPKVKLEKLL